jgi:hypothetical protein
MASSLSLASPSRAGFVAVGLLGVVYLATTALDVTWWDAGEFIAAAHTLGIPHPPGTPLYILLANVWARTLGFIDTAFAVNLLSAACTAAAGGIAATLMARGVRSSAAGLAAALCAGTMATVWLSATEAEVYGPSLCLGMLMLWSGDRAGRLGDRRAVVLTAYLFALAAPLHVTALVAAPAAVVLASTGSDDRPRWWTTAALSAAFVFAAGMGTGRWWLALSAFAALVSVIVARRITRGRQWPGDAPISLVFVLLVGISALAFLIVRAAHDPAINQGNPSEIGTMLGVIARTQYDVAGLWPRQAPIWLQFVNLLEYVDWQVALGLAPGVTPSVPRTMVSVIYIVLGAIGGAAHYHVDRRSWRGFAVLGLCGSLGVLAYLNLKAGPSIGYGILPDDAPHEPRERDYFFAFAFWTWGLWAGVGAVTLLRARMPSRRQFAMVAGVALAALPIILNWTAVTRRAEPDASIPADFARELLEAAPRDAILLVAGDNDTYPLWYLQQVRAIRRDVTVVTYPLVAAGWYRQELSRRWGLGSATADSDWRGLAVELRSIAASARQAGRPVVAAVTVERTVREYLGGDWKLIGLVYAEAGAPSGMGPVREPPASFGAVLPAMDSGAVARAEERLAPLLRDSIRESIDPTTRMMRRALECPAIVRRAASDTSAASLLESACNSR